VGCTGTTNEGLHYRIESDGEGFVISDNHVFEYKLHSEG